MKKLFAAIISILVFSFCSGPPKQEADFIIHHAVIYSVDSSFTVFEAMAIKDGKIMELNTNEKILDTYSSEDVTNAEGKTVFPGFIDAHCHFLNYGLGLQQLDLVGTKSFEEVIEKVIAFEKSRVYDTREGVDKAQRIRPWIVGRGWDQNDWAVKEYPTKKILDSLFPNTPIILKRIDGHAALANSEALKRAGVDKNTKLSGGEIIKDVNGNLIGILIDNAVDLVTAKIPSPSQEQYKGALLAAQKNCFEVGLTTVDDAGLMKGEIDVIDELQKKGELKMRVYAMLSDSGPNYRYYLEKGPYKTDRLNVRSFKFYGDGALGSRGACLINDYSDKSNWKGFLLSSADHYDKQAGIIENKGFQMNTHCIGDSAMRIMLAIYGINPRIGFDTDGKLLREISKEKRWRIEHAQVVDKKDLEYVKDLSVIPSIQPTHATSDMYWAGERLGKERVKNAYAYKDLLKAAGLVAIGTDFPVEDISPFKTFYAAVYRKDAKGFPEGGFQMENALTREETLKGMTIWAAFSNFEEKEKGSLEKGKFADFVILDTDLMKCGEEEILKAKVLETFLNGERVYKK